MSIESEEIIDTFKELSNKMTLDIREMRAETEKTKNCISSLKTTLENTNKKLLFVLEQQKIMSKNLDALSSLPSDLDRIQSDVSVIKDTLIEQSEH